MKCHLRSSALLSITLLVIGSVAAMADNYEDNCVLAVMKTVPAAAHVEATTVAPASPDTLQRLSRTGVGFRWVQINYTLSIGGRKITKSQICATHPYGGWTLVPLDGQPGEDQIVR